MEIFGRKWLTHACMTYYISQKANTLYTHIIIEREREYDFFYLLHIFISFLHTWKQHYISFLDSGHHLIVPWYNYSVMSHFLLLFSILTVPTRPLSLLKWYQYRINISTSENITPTYCFFAYYIYIYKYRIAWVKVI